MHCQEALSIVPNHLKSHYRAARALNELGNYQSALDFAQNGLILDPENKVWDKYHF